MTQTTKTTENTRREAILAAALPLFLVNGYEKTSIRMIASKVGCEVGLVYYYFATKEEVFESALALYFEDKKNALSEITERTKKDATLFIDTLFNYFEKESPTFAETFGEGVHWSVRLSVRSKFAELLMPFTAEAVSILSDSSRMPYSEDITAKTVTDLLVNTALDVEKPFSTRKDELRRMISTILGTDKIASRRRDIPSFLL
jgi:AcrR family transcriptional regulator